MPNSQCHGSGFSPAGPAQSGCTKPYRPALAVIHCHSALPPWLMPPQRSTASAQPWLDVPGKAARRGLARNADTCAAKDR